MRLRRSIAVLLAPTLLLLAGCGGDDTEGGSGEEVTEAPVETPAEETEEPETEETVPEETSAAPEPTEPTEAAEPSGATDAELTAPGTELAVGDAAIVPVEYDDGEGVAEVVVTEIRKGKAASLADVDGAEGFVPWHVSWEVTAVSGAADIGLWGPSVDLDGIGADGTPGATIITTAAIDGCASESAPSDWVDGDSFSGCFTTAAPEGTAISSVTYDLDDSPYDKFDGQPVVWQG